MRTLWWGVELSKPILDKVVSWSEKKGAKEAEAFFSTTESIHVRFEKKSINLSERKRSSGYGIRTVVDKSDGLSVGFASSTDASTQALKSTVDRALGIARSKPPDRDFVQLQQPSSLKPRKIDFDPLILERDPVELLELVQSLIVTADSSSKIRTVSGSLFLSRSKTAVANSLGVSGYYKASNFDVGVFVTSKDGDSVGVGWDRFSATTINETAALKCAQEAGETSILQLHPRKIEPGRFPVLICPEGFSQILSNTLIPEVNAENVYNKESPFYGRIGETIGPEMLTIYDNGMLPGGIGSKPLDDEGCTTRKTEVIGKGILKNLLHNSYTSNRIHAENTGNSFRSGGRRGATRYSAEPSIAPTNIVVKPGNVDREELVGQLGEGIVVKGFIGAHTANSRTGEFSLVLYCAYKIEKGELAYPIHEAVVGSSIQELIRNVTDIGNDSKQIPIGHQVGVASPSLVVEDLAISG